MAIFNDGLRQCQLRIARVWPQLPTTAEQLMGDFLTDVAEEQERDCAGFITAFP